MENIFYLPDVEKNMFFKKPMPCDSSQHSTCVRLTVLMADHHFLKTYRQPIAGQWGKAKC